MQDAIAAELARSERTGVPPSVLLLDLDHFRRVNDVFGHAAGDRVLSEIAGRLQSRLRGYDVLGRWGGEQFIVLAPGVPDDATLRRLADQIRRLVGTLPVAIGDALLPVTSRSAPRAPGTPCAPSKGSSTAPIARSRQPSAGAATASSCSAT